MTYRADTKSKDNHSQTYQRKKTPKVRKAELSFLYATRRLVLFYISTKYHKNIQRVFDLQNGHKINGLSLSNTTMGDNAKVRKAELSFLYATRPLVLFYISAKYHQNIPKNIPVTEQRRNL